MTRLLPAFILVASVSVCVRAADEPLAADSARILLVDNAYVHSMHNLKRTLHRLKPHPRNPLIVQDRPWECDKGFFFYPSVVNFADSVLRHPKTGQFRFWYRGYMSRDERGKHTSLLLLAESDDGLSWEKPTLGVVRWNGSTDNNIVLAAEDGPGPWRLLGTASVIFRSDGPESENPYWLLTHIHRDNEKGIYVYRSPDGVRWQLSKKDAVPNAREFNSFFWDPRTKKYIGTVRMKRPVTPRHVGHSESEDLLNWTSAKVVMAPEDLNTKYNLPGDDVYGMCSFPYESHYLSFLHTHHRDRRLEVQLLSSRDARHWDFVADGQYILPNDPRGGYGQGMMSTQSGSPIRMGDQLWVYIGMSPRAHRNPEFQSAPGQQQRVIGLATLRLDGFASLDADDTPGTLTTVPLRFQPGTLRINAATESDGFIKAELIDRSGNPVAGYSAEHCRPFVGDSTRAELSWLDRASVPPSTTSPLSLRFLMTKAELYAFWIDASEAN